MTNLIGQSLGRYHILEQLGEGGMAIVYKAYDTRLETDVAVKVIRTENLTLGTMERTLKRFEREAKSLARLTHPNIVKVTDYGEFEGKPYLVMEYLPGGTLKDRIKQGQIPWQEAIRLILPIAQALEYAHEHNIIHRDVKPSNILLTEKGQPMLTDFGVAKLFDMESTADLTGTGMGIGTPEYMAPEQWQGQVSLQTDVYALGVVLYEMVTGRRPYTADTLAALLIKVINDPLPRPKNFVPGLPEGVERVILKTVAKRRENRYQDLPAVINALGGLLSEKQTLGSQNSGIVRQTKTIKYTEPVSITRTEKAPTSKNNRSNFNWLLLGGIGSIFLIGVFVIMGLFSLFAPTATQTPTFTPLPTDTLVVASPTDLLPVLTVPPLFTPTQEFTPTPEITFTPVPTLTSEIAFAPILTPVEGGHGQFAFASDHTGVPQIYLANISDGASAQSLTNIPLGACQPTWSPDGKKIAFTSPCGGPDETFQNATIYVLDGITMELNPLLTQPSGDYDPAWSPDGNRIAFVSARDGRPRIYLADVSTGMITPLTEPSAYVEEMRYPAWSPTGFQLTYTAKQFGVYQIWVMGDTGDGQEQVVRSGQDFWDTHPVWSPDSSTIWFSRRRLGAGGKYYLVNIRYDERYGEGTRQDFGKLPIFNVHFSPDGFWMIFEGEEEEGNTDIFIMTASGADRTRLTLDPGTDFDPAWRP